MADPASVVLSIVIPLFNEEETVAELVRRTLEQVRRLDVTCEVLLVDDGSRDRTLQRITHLSQLHPELRVLELSRNFGHMAALQAGIAQSRGKAVITLDGDLQDPPELIPRLFSKWREGSELVLAVRTARDEPLLRRWGTTLFYGLLRRVSEIPIPSQVGTYGLMDRQVVETLNQMPARVRFFAGLRIWAGGRTATVSYDRPARPYGASKVGTLGLIRLALVALVSFSKAPLRFASALSLLFSIALFLLGFSAVLIRLMTHLAIPGWATTTTLLGLIGSIQSLVLAILSEYVAVLFDEIKGRPLYRIQREIRGGVG